jgi:hypothetical protein
VWYYQTDVSWPQLRMMHHSKELRSGKVQKATGKCKLTGKISVWEESVTDKWKHNKRQAGETKWEEESWWSCSVLANI